MMRKYACVLTAASALAVAACSKSSSAPTTPSSASGGNSAAAADGSTLKASAPTPLSPINNTRPQTPDITLTVQNAGLKYGSGEGVSFTYRFEVYNASGARIYQSSLVASGVNTTSHTIPFALEGDQAYSWQARVEYQGEIGPWSSRGTFTAPQTTGYIRGNEMYDPLINGRTVGNVNGPVTFIPGLGAKLENQLAHISYVLPQTLFEGEFSLLVTGMPANTEGDKTKLFAMGEGFDDIVTNDRRMTVEKRGDPPGIIAWRFITHDDQIDTEGPTERLFYNFQESQTYFFQATWRNNRFNLLIREGGFDGRQIYNMGKNFHGRPYDPDPHVLYVGAPVGRSGESGASVDRAIIRQVWVSGRQRPAFANR